VLECICHGPKYDKTVIRPIWKLDRTIFVSVIVFLCDMSFLYIFLILGIIKTLKHLESSYGNSVAIVISQSHYSYLYVYRYMIDRLHFTPEDAIEGKNLHVHSHGAGDERTPPVPTIVLSDEGEGYCVFGVLI